MAIDDARDLVERLAFETGFRTVRFAPVSDTPDVERYDAWLAAGHHGEMDYLARGRDVRADPRLKLAGARSAVVLAVEYHHERPPDPGGRTGLVARYAWGRDYHNLVGKRLRKLRARLGEHGVESWGGVDAAPILERSWAALAGMGFLGKNAMIFSPGRTSWMFLAVLFVTAPCRPDAPLARDHCGSCHRCLSACPTDAFRGPRSVDATRCIAYWTIEARGLAPRDLRPGFGRWAFGCDVCQEVCPHNHGPPDPDEDGLRPRHAWLDLDAILAASDAELIERYTGTPLRRPGGAGLKRNALVVLGNLGDPGGVPAARTGLAHPEPVVRAAAVWCLSRLGDRTVLDHADPDALVTAEVDAARNLA